jgi:hypothetical protein
VCGLRRVISTRQQHDGRLREAGAALVHHIPAHAVAPIASTVRYDLAPTADADAQ